NSSSRKYPDECDDRNYCSLGPVEYRVQESRVATRGGALNQFREGSLAGYFAETRQRGWLDSSERQPNPKYYYPLHPHECFRGKWLYYCSWRPNHRQQDKEL